MTRQQVRKKNAKSPYLCRRGTIGLFEKDLGSGISGGAKEKCIVWGWETGIRHDGTAKVNQLHLHKPSVISIHGREHDC